MSAASRHHTLVEVPFLPTGGISPPPHHSHQLLEVSLGTCLHQLQRPLYQQLPIQYQYLHMGRKRLAPPALRDRLLEACDISWAISHLFVPKQKEAEDHIQVPALPLTWCVAMSKDPLEPRLPHLCTELAPGTLSEESASVHGNYNKPFKWEGGFLNVSLIVTYPAIKCLFSPTALQVHLKWWERAGESAQVANAMSLPARQSLAGSCSSPRGVH